MMGSTSFASPGDVHHIIESSVEQFDQVNDYTCRLDKRVRKGDTMYEELNIFVKYMKPTHYYFRWDQGPQKGQEAIFIAGENSGRIVAHSGGFFRFLTLHLTPEGSIAMEKNRHPLSHSGLEKIMYLIETNYELSRKSGQDTIRYKGNDRYDGRDVLVIEGVFPEGQGYYAHVITISLDREIKLPVKVSVYDWSDTLVEEYVFRDLSINVGLSRHDFDLDNPEYNFH